RWHDLYYRRSSSPDRMPVPERMFRIAGCWPGSLHFARDLSESQLEKETTPAGRRRGDRKASTPRPQGFGAWPERAGESVAARRPVLPVTKVWPARAGLGGGMKARWVTPVSCKPQRQVATYFRATAPACIKLRAETRKQKWPMQAKGHKFREPDAGTPTTVVGMRCAPSAEPRRSVWVPEKRASGKEPAAVPVPIRRISLRSG